jgi:predicted house-cleaning noncanonical NTP pyrophosphatase (MazG superfamily)
MQIIKDFNISDIIQGRYAIHCNLEHEETKILSFFNDIFDFKLCDNEKYVRISDNTNILTKNNLRVFDNNKIIHSGALVSKIVLSSDFLEKVYNHKSNGTDIPKKLIRSKIVPNLQDNEWYYCDNKDELNKLFALKIQEELSEVTASGNSDIYEFADLLETVFSFAKLNGYDHKALKKACLKKANERGSINNIVLTNLDPDNVSNKIYIKNS